MNPHAFLILRIINASTLRTFVYLGDDQDPLATCSLGAFRGFAIGFYIIVGVPLFAFTIGLVAGLFFDILGSRTKPNSRNTMRRSHLELSRLDLTHSEKSNSESNVALPSNIKVRIDGLNMCGCAEDYVERDRDQAIHWDVNDMLITKLVERYGLNAIDLHDMKREIHHTILERQNYFPRGSHPYDRVPLGVYDMNDRTRAHAYESHAGGVGGLRKKMIWPLKYFYARCCLRFNPNTAAQYASSLGGTPVHGDARKLSYSAEEGEGMTGLKVQPNNNCSAAIHRLCTYCGLSACTHMSGGTAGSPGMQDEGASSSPSGIHTSTPSRGYSSTCTLRRRSVIVPVAIITGLLLLALTVELDREKLQKVAKTLFESPSSPDSQYQYRQNEITINSRDS
jgi:hypothetical protein